jgi:acetyl-CoA carboxylase biotin carboxyl carrier protein
MSEIRAPITGSVWQLLVAAGDTVQPDEVVAVLESMKLEIPVEAEDGGVVLRVLVAVGDAVTEGDPMVELEAHRA